jgi:hypothetical protein
MSKTKNIYIRVYQGKYDSDGVYHCYQKPTRENIDQMLEWGLAIKISEKEYSEGRAVWGSGHYMIEEETTHTGNTQFDSSG